MKRLLLAFVIVLMPGCAPPVLPDTFAGICGLKPIGQNEEGITFVYAVCEAKK